MATTYKTPSQIAQQYLLYVKSFKPEVDTDRTDSDWWVRGQVVGGVVAGVYADQRRMADDAFPQSARTDALLQHLDLYFDGGFTDAQPSKGFVSVPGATGASIPQGMQLVYPPNGSLYTVTTTTPYAGATAALVPVQSVGTGQVQNLLQGAVLTIPSPPAGVQSTATVVNGNLADGRDTETPDEARGRILTQVRTPLAGGKTADYQQFALAADPSVTSASIIRYPFGFGSVGIVITAGTTDIDTALNEGQPIIVTPSQALIDKVQAYIDTQCPTTDFPTVFPPASVGVNVVVNVRFANGDINTLLNDPLNPNGGLISQGSMVQREVKRAIYKTPAGGRQLGGQGYVVAAEIAETIDVNLSATPYIVGSAAQLVADRQVQNLSATGANLSISGFQVPVPGSVTVIEGGF